jgi:hypothetical protein
MSDVATLEPTVVTPEVVPVTPAAADPWSDYLSKHAEPTKLEPYRNAKNSLEAFELAQSRLTEAQTALRTRQPGLPGKPAADAPPAVVAAWRTAHGLPETPEGYGLTKPEGVADDLYDADEAAAFAKFAHEQGMAPDTVKALQKWYAENTTGKLGAMQQQQQAQDEALRASEAAQLSKLYGDRLDTTLRDLQAMAQAAGKPQGIFDPASPDFWGVEAVEFAAKIVQIVPRGEDAAVRTMGSPLATGQFDLAWAKASIVPGHSDYEAVTNPRHPRFQELSQLRNLAYAAGR